jgi:hypothetical protein
MGDPGVVVHAHPVGSGRAEGMPFPLPGTYNEPHAPLNSRENAIKVLEISL